MLNRAVAAFQASFLSRIPHRDEDIASVAETNRPTISKWRHGQQALALEEAFKLADAYGWDLVFGPRAEVAGYRIQRDNVAPALDLIESAGRVAEIGTDYFRAKVRALRDGRMDKHERAQLRGMLRELLAEVEASDAGLREEAG